MKDKFIILFVLFSLLFTAKTYCGRESISSAEAKLKALQKKLEKVRKERKKLKSQELEILATLQNMDEEMTITTQIIKEMETKKELLTENINDLNNKIAITDSLIDNHRSILEKRLRYIYKFGHMSSLDVLFSSYTFADAITRIKYLTIIAKLDERIFQEYKTLQDSLKSYKSNLENNAQQLSLIEEQATNELAAVEKEKADKKQLLREIRRKRSKQRKLERELLASRKRLQRIIQKLEKERKAQKVTTKSYFGKLRGKLPWPVVGKVISRYGTKRHPKYHTATKNNGIDIKAPYNTPVSAVSYGEVAYADKFLGYGNVVLIDHYGGYYTLYAHLATIDVNVKDKVYQGQVIGRVGDTGSLEGPILHFEIRVKGKTVNPLNWLSRR